MDGIVIKEFSNNLGKACLEISSDKFKTTFTIQPAHRQHHFYEVVTKGKTSPAIQGLFMSIGDARDAVKRHIRSSKPSKAVARDRAYEERHGTKNRT